MYIGRSSDCEPWCNGEAKARQPPHTVATHKTVQYPLLCSRRNWKGTARGLQIDLKLANDDSNLSEIDSIRMERGPLVTHSFYKWEQVHTEYVTGMKESRHNALVSQWWYSVGGLHRPQCHSQQHCGCCKIKRMKSSDLTLRQWALSSSWYRKLPSLMWPVCVGSSWRMKALMHVCFIF